MRESGGLGRYHDVPSERRGAHVPLRLRVGTRRILHLRARCVCVRVRVFVRVGVGACVRVLQGCWFFSVLILHPPVAWDQVHYKCMTNIDVLSACSSVCACVRA